MRRFVLEQDLAQRVLDCVQPVILFFHRQSNSKYLPSAVMPEDIEKPSLPRKWQEDLRRHTLAEKQYTKMDHE